MSLFQPRPQAAGTPQQYTLGQRQIRLLVGLGNPGKKYDKNRHNLGWRVLGHFCQSQNFSQWSEEKKFLSQICEAQISDNKVIAQKPQTMMNLSGHAIQKIINFYKLRMEDIMVVHDELDIPFGKIKVQYGGSSAGHNGIQSIIDLIGTDFNRLRIGIANDNSTDQDASIFVLQNFDENEEKQMINLYKEITAIISEWLWGQEIKTETRNFIV